MVFKSNKDHSNIVVILILYYREMGRMGPKGANQTTTPQSPLVDLQNIL